MFIPHMRTLAQLVDADEQRNVRVVQLHDAPYVAAGLPAGTNSVTMRAA
jgi:hypothetical protein